jgi:NADP-dependent 3-hydroxy acid dehydrogenase YdfG
VVLGARRPEPLADLAARIADAGGEAVYASTDVRRREDLVALVDLALERFGRLDVLVSNAGVMPVSAFDELRVDDWMEMIDVNIKGVLHGIAAALPVFREQGSGHFVTTASTAAHRIVATMGVYAGTKMAVRAISEALRQEADGRLRVTVVSPGMTATSFGSAELSPQLRAALEIAMPPDAVGRAIAYAIEQPDDIDVGEVIIRPTAQT